MEILVYKKEINKGSFKNKIKLKLIRKKFKQNPGRKKSTLILLVNSFSFLYFNQTGKQINAKMKEILYKGNKLKVILKHNKIKSREIKLKDQNESFII